VSTTSQLARERLPNQRWAESSLVPHPHRLELKGALDSLSWPNVCAYCASRADELIEVRKVVRRRPRRGGGSSLNSHIIARARIPYCSSCAQQHRAMEVRPSAGHRIFATLFHPLIIPIVGSLFFLRISLPTALTTSPFAEGGWIAWGLPALFLFIIVWTGFLLLRMTRERDIPAPTEITQACDFSGNVSQLFEGERHIYRLRNETFAQALAKLNPDRMWTDQDQASSRRRMHITSIALLALIVLAWVVVYVFRL
jgi:hypothetical protein